MKTIDEKLYVATLGVLIAAIGIFSIVYIAIDDQKPTAVITTEIGPPPGSVEVAAQIGYVKVIDIRLQDGTRCIGLYRAHHNMGGISCNWK